MAAIDCPRTAFRYPKESISPRVAIFGSKPARTIGDRKASRAVMCSVFGDADRRRSTARIAKNFCACGRRGDTSCDARDVMRVTQTMSARPKFLAKRVRTRVACMRKTATTFCASSGTRSARAARRFSSRTAARATTRKAVTNRKEFVA